MVPPLGLNKEALTQRLLTGKDIRSSWTELTAQIGKSGLARLKAEIRRLGGSWKQVLERRAEQGMPASELRKAPHRACLH